jgi:hypothetical protein
VEKSSGIGFTSALLLVFIVLRLVGVTDWSWWWVLSPLWISVGLTLLVVGALFVGALFIDAIDDLKSRRHFSRVAKEARNRRG